MISTQHQSQSSNQTVADPERQSPPLPPREICRRARLSRDPRFDGEFFIGVKTTGIYCRPICAARPPAEKNVNYYASSALAAAAGFRPCLRCRPESAPNSPAWQGSSVTVRRALRLIDEGALNEAGVAQLAERLGIGERYLRKLFQRELGVSPSSLALNQRLLFAKKLLAETSLSITDVAGAAGFGSIRRFNAAIQEHFKLAPRTLRRHARETSATQGIRLQLHYRPPYDWDGVEAFFARHAIEGLETVSAGRYQRNLAIDGIRGSICVTPNPKRDSLQLDVHLDKQQLLMPVVANVRRMFDLDADPQAVARVLKRDKALGALLKRYPGIRAPGYSSLWESAVRAIVGQQVSVAAARGVLQRLCSASNSNGTFPAPSALGGLKDDQFPMPGKRRDSLRALCTLFASQLERIQLDDIAALSGVGPWTVDMIAIRGAGQPDHFPLADLGLMRAYEALSAQSDLKRAVQEWSPWRSYAANLLWRSLE